MRSLGFVAVSCMACAVAACGHSGVAGSARAKPSGQPTGTPSDKNADDQAIVLSEQLLHGDQTKLAPWMAYGLAKMAILGRRQGRNPNAGVDDFDTEYKGREMLVKVWKNLQAKQGGSEPYFDLLATITDAGFLAEYVIAGYARPGWTIPADTVAQLRFPAFFTWAQSHVRDHTAPTLATVHKGSLPPDPRVLGERLPAPESLSPERLSCRRSLSRLVAARQAWLSESKTTTAAPLAAADRKQFVALLRWATDHATDYPNGVVWVSSKAQRITFFTGYCAVDLQDHQAAIPILREAVALAPLSPAPRSELVQALAATHQLAAALAEDDRLLALPVGKCTTGIAWRKRGFILFEMGRLKEAYDAYQKSLAFDPHSKVAYDELVLLASELNRSGQLKPSERARYTPPPSEQVTSTCRDDE